MVSAKMHVYMFDGAEFITNKSEAEIDAALADFRAETSLIATTKKHAVVGAVGFAQGYQNVCLATALRALNMPVQHTANGPFSVAVGSAMISHLDMELVQTDSPMVGLTHGKYVVWRDFYFMAIEIKPDGITLPDEVREMEVRD